MRSTKNKVNVSVLISLINELKTKNKKNTNFSTILTFFLKSIYKIKIFVLEISSIREKNI